MEGDYGGQGRTLRAVRGRYPGGQAMISGNSD